MKLKIPKYAQEMMRNARFDLTYRDDRWNPGYTIRIHKGSDYQKIDTFAREIDRLLKWAERNYAYTELIYIPKKTHYCKQYAIVTITDPVMQKIEKYITLPDVTR